jgi:uncharacterized protein YdaU (DUF1376 family)
MKFYKRDPARALEGMRELTLEQIGLYNLLIDLLYCRDGIVPDDDVMVPKLLNIDPRAWRRLKTQLMAAGKVRCTFDGRLTANGVDEVRHLAEIQSTSARHQVNVRWENYRKMKENNGSLIQRCNTPIDIDRKKEREQAVDNVDNSELNPESSNQAEPSKVAETSKEPIQEPIAAPEPIPKSSPPTRMPTTPISAEDQAILNAALAYSDELVATAKAKGWI